MKETCPYCNNDPYEYVDIGIGSEAVAVNCCEYGYRLIMSNEPKNKIDKDFAADIENMDDDAQVMIYSAGYRSHLEYHVEGGLEVDGILFLSEGVQSGYARQELRDEFDY